MRFQVGAVVRREKYKERGVERKRENASSQGRDTNNHRRKQKSDIIKLMKAQMGRGRTKNLSVE